MYVTLVYIHVYRIITKIIQNLQFCHLSLALNNWCLLCYNSVRHFFKTVIFRFITHFFISCKYFLFFSVTFCLV